MISALLPFYADALVDYSEQGTTAPAPQARNTPAVAPAGMVRREAPRAQNNGPASFQLSSGYETLDLSLHNESAKVGFMKFNAHFQTNYDIFMAASFWRASTTSALLTESSDAQNGNPTAILGFNWLRFGAAHEMASIDLFGGGSFKGNSEFASSRSDTIAGVETSKRFYDFFLGLGYEIRLTGTPENENEMNIGNIQKLSASIGWRATPDIQFIIEGASYSIKAGDQNKNFTLSEKESFASVTPKLGLFLRPLFQVELGARFQTKEPNSQSSLVQARLWDLSGAYGNSMFASLNFSL